MARYLLINNIKKTLQTSDFIFVYSYKMFKTAWFVAFLRLYPANLQSRVYKNHFFCIFHIHD